MMSPRLAGVALVVLPGMEMIAGGELIEAGFTSRNGVFQELRR